MHVAKPAMKYKWHNNIKESERPSCAGDALLQSLALTLLSLSIRNYTCVCVSWGYCARMLVNFRHIIQCVCVA